MQSLTIDNGALTLGTLIAMLFLMTLLGGLMLFLYKSTRLRMELMELSARHAREIEAVQKEIFRQTIDEISRDLHDDFAQRLFFINIRINTLLPELMGKQHASLLETKHLTAQLIDDLRNLTRYLQINSATDLHLPEIIGEELERIKRAGFLYTSLNLDGVPRELDAKTCLFVYRIVQESLKNVVAHARASTCQVVLHYDDDCLRLGIRDDGVGFTPSVSSKGLGLKNIRQRSSLINASLSIDSAPNAGTTISIDIPYPPSTVKT